MYRLNFTRSYLTNDLGLYTIINLNGISSSTVIIRKVRNFGLVFREMMIKMNTHILLHYMIIKEKEQFLFIVTFPSYIRNYYIHVQTSLKLITSDQFKAWSNKICNFFKPLIKIERNKSFLSTVVCHIYRNS